MPRAIWRHFIILAAVLAVPQACGLAGQFHGDAPHLGWPLAVFVGTVMSLGFASNLAWGLSTAAGIAVGTTARGRAGVRAAAMIVLTATAIIVACDTIIGPRADAYLREAAARAAISETTAWPRFFNNTTIYSRTDTLGSLRTGLQLLIERPPALSAKLGSSWSQDHPRALATNAAQFAPLLLLPLIAVGFASGASEWIRQRVSFRAPRDEVVARWLLAWVLVCSVTGYLSRWAGQVGYATLHGQVYWLPMRMFWPGLIIAALGWRFAARTASRERPAMTT